jgi:hypothetical protein
MAAIIQEFKAGTSEPNPAPEIVELLDMQLAVVGGGIGDTAV